MNPVWRRLKAVVLESDDWGLCAWSPDPHAYRVLTDTPAFRSPVGRIYGRSTLESAEDVRKLTESLLEFRGGDGFPPVWQANTVVAAPDYERLDPPLFLATSLPVLTLPDAPSRWLRPGLWEEVARACASGVWYPELHGFHHLPERAWLTALKRNMADARRAFAQQCPVCEAVEASGEFDPSEPGDSKVRNLTLAIEVFRRMFGRVPSSFCPPDYRWDDRFEDEAEKLGITLWQGRGERMGEAFPRLRRLAGRLRWSAIRGSRFYMPQRIAFEPRGGDGRDGPAGIDAAQRRIREAWSRGRPAVVSTHRLSYAHLDPRWSEAGRGALRDLVQRLVGEGAIFLTDAEARGIDERGWSVRELGTRGALVRYYDVPQLPIRVPAPAGTTGVLLREGRGPEGVEVTHEGDAAIARLEQGEYLLEWSAA